MSQHVSTESSTNSATSYTSYGVYVSPVPTKVSNKFAQEPTNKPKWLLVTFIALIAIASVVTGGVCFYMHLVNAFVGWLIVGTGAGVFVGDIVASVIMMSSCGQRRMGEEKKIEQAFWTTLLEDAHLFRLFNMIMLNTKDGRGEAADLLVNEYIRTFGKENFTTEQKGKLVKSICLQLIEFSDLPTSRLSRRIAEHELTADPILTPATLISNDSYFLDDGRKLLICESKGDGGCGIHALLGKPNKKGIFECDIVKSERKAFCDWIRAQYRSDKLPEQISAVLEEYFLHWENKFVPEALKTKENNALRARCLTAKNAAKRNMEAENLALAEFKDKILESYLAHLEKIGTYLLQEELIAAAYCFNKTLVLYPNWKATKEASPTAYSIHNKGASDPVHICFNGHDHFERAFPFSE